MAQEKSKDLADALAETLREMGASVVDLSRERFPGAADFMFSILLRKTKFRIYATTIPFAFPRDVRGAIWSLKKQVSQDRNLVPLILAENISPGARELLKEERVAYFDSSGSFYLEAVGAFILIDKPSSKKQSKVIDKLFAGTRARVLHAVWNSRGNWFGGQDIAEWAMVSPTTASHTLIELERREWVSTRGAGPAKKRRLVEPAALLDAWATFASGKRLQHMRHYYIQAQSPSQIISLLDHSSSQRQVPYAVTGLVAGQHYAPHLSNVSLVQCRIGNGDDMVLADLGATPVSNGYNLTVICSDDAEIVPFRRREDKFWVTDPLQTYIDLLQFKGGRAKELAQHLREEIRIR